MLADLPQARLAEGIAHKTRGVAHQQRGLQRQCHAVDHVARAVLKIAQVFQIGCQRGNMLVQQGLRTARLGHFGKKSLHHGRCF